jgi:hypothetical protein
VLTSKNTWRTRERRPMVGWFGLEFESLRFVGLGLDLNKMCLNLKL